MGGSGGLCKAGPGTLVLTASNTFTGPTVVNAGALNLAALSRNPEYGPLYGSPLLTINAGATANAVGYNAMKGFNGGNMNVTVNGGTLTATGGNQSMGTVILNGGLVAGSGDGGYYGSFNLHDGASVTNNSAITANYVTGASGASTPITVSPGVTLNWSGIIMDPRGSTTTLNFAGAGTTVLSGNNTYTGGTFVEGSGTLQVGNNSAFGRGGLTADNGTVDLNGLNPSVTTLNGSAGTITSSALGRELDSQ